MRVYLEDAMFGAPVLCEERREFIEVATIEGLVQYVKRWYQGDAVLTVEEDGALCISEHATCVEREW